MFFLRLVLLILFVLVWPLNSLAGVSPRIGILEGDLWSQGEPVFSGGSLRVYTALWNGGSVVIEGTVVFKADNKEFGRQSFRLPPSELRDVSVKWQTVAGTSTLSAEVFLSKDNLKILSRAKSNPLNIFIDNDTDGDGIGDNLDEDDDNDGLSDHREQELKTNPRKSDTDGDKIPDGRDPLPFSAQKAENKPTPSVSAVLESAGSIASSAPSSLGRILAGTAETVSDFTKGPGRAAAVKTDKNIRDFAATAAAVVSQQKQTVKNKLAQKDNGAFPPSSVSENQGKGLRGRLNSLLAGVGGVNRPLTYVSYLGLAGLSFVLERPVLVYVVLSFLVLILLRSLFRR